MTVFTWAFQLLRKVHVYPRWWGQRHLQDATGSVSLKFRMPGRFLAGSSVNSRRLRQVIRPRTAAPGAKGWSWDHICSVISISESSTWLRGFIGAPCLIQVSKHRGCCESSGAFQRCPAASVGVLALCHCRVRTPWSVWRHLSGSSSKRINTDRLRFTSVALPWQLGSIWVYHMHQEFQWQALLPIIDMGSFLFQDAHAIATTWNLESHGVCLQL